MNAMSRTHVGDVKLPELSIRYTTAQVALDPDHKFTICVVSNPDPINGKTLGPYQADGVTPRITGDGLTLSCQPDGSLEVRPAGAWAEFEVVVIDGAGNVTFWPGQAFKNSPNIPTPQRGTCYKFIGTLNIPVVRP
jgi:hypothetical protein